MRDMNSKAIDTLLADLSDDNPSPRGCDWYSREQFDPPPGLSEIKYAAARGWFETIFAPDGDVSFRLTDLGIEAGRHWAEISPTASTASKAKDLVADLISDGIEEKWIARDDFDPPHTLDDIRRAARRRLILIDETRGPSRLRMRLTPLGRQRIGAMGAQPEEGNVKAPNAPK